MALLLVNLSFVSLILAADKFKQVFGEAF